MDSNYSEKNLSLSSEDDSYDSESDAEETYGDDTLPNRSEFLAEEDLTSARSSLPPPSPTALSADELDGNSLSKTPSRRPSSSSKSTKRSSRRSTTSGEDENEADQLLPPEKHLRRAHRRIRKLLKTAKDHPPLEAAAAASNDVSILDDFIRCIPLTRILFGDFHWRLARSHADLALAYLDLMQLPIQAQDHASTAKTLLTQNVHLSDNPLEKVAILETFLVVYYAFGRSMARLDKDAEAEKALIKCEKIHAEFAKLPAVDSNVVVEWEVKIVLAIARLFAKRRNYVAAEDEFRRCLDLTEKLTESTEDVALVPVLLDLAKMKLSVGTISQIEASIEVFLRAHTINVAVRDPGEGEHDLATARSALALGQAYATLDTDDSNVSAEAYVRQATEALEAILGIGHEETQFAQSTLAKLLIRMTKSSEAVDLLKAKIRGRFQFEGGEFSETMATDHHLVASVFLAGGDVEKAAAHLNKCLDIRKVVLGPNHRKTKDTLAIIKSISH